MRRIPKKPKHGRSATHEPCGDASARQILAVAAAIVVGCALAYSNTFGVPFIFDDETSIRDNPTIVQLWPLWGVLSPPNTATPVDGRPVLNLSFALNYAVGGFKLWGYHLVNLSIHILAAWTLFGIVRRTLEGRGPTCRRPLNEKDAVRLASGSSVRLAAVGTTAKQLASDGTSAILPAAAVALLWALHPLQTQAVTYISQRAESLVALFYLLTLYCTIRAADSRRSLAWSAAATASCALGMASKEVMVSAPLIVLLYDRAFLFGSFRETFRKRWGMYAALAATWILLAALMIRSGARCGTTGFGIEKFTVWSYLLTQSAVLVRYLRLAFWPVGLCLDYEWPAALSLGEVLLPGLIVVSLLVLTLWALVKRPAWGFLGAWFFAILAPTSSFVPINDAAFEHRMYLPLAAIVAAAVVGGSLAGRWLVRRRLLTEPAARNVLIFSAVAISIVYGVLTFHRNRDYGSTLSIWRDTASKAPNNPRAHINLGNALSARKRNEEALAELQKAIEIKPDSFIAHNNLGMVLAEMGRIDAAISHYEKALEIKPDFVDAHSNISVALVGRGRIDEAIAHCRRALEIRPNYANVYNNIGLALAGRGQIDEAIVQYRKALEINPNHPEANNNLANSLARCGQFDEAVERYGKALDASPNTADIHNNLALALAEAGRIAEALVHFRKALEIQPQFTQARDNLNAIQTYREQLLKKLAECRERMRAQPDDISSLNDLAWLLATNLDASLRNGPEAVKLAERAVELSGGRQPAVLDTLGAAYATSGRFGEAVQTAQKALELATGENRQAMAESIRARIRLYEAKIPFYAPVAAAAKQP
jgi:protein O-mannosyl-transferase